MLVSLHNFKCYLERLIRGTRVLYPASTRGFVDENVALVQVVFRVLWLFLVNIIPLRLRILSFICHRRYTG